MNSCMECGNSSLKQEKVSSYKYTGSEIPVTLVNSVQELTCEKCGAKFEVIHDLDSLSAAIAVGRVMSRTKLTGKEIKFLRKSLGLRAVELAPKIEVAAETLSRYEQGKAVMSPKTEKQLRILVAATLENKVPAMDVDIPSIFSMEINPIINPNEPLMSFELVKFKIGSEKKKEWDIEEKLAA